jgi:hypothetical protein
MIAATTLAPVNSTPAGRAYSPTVAIAAVCTVSGDITFVDALEGI